MWGWVTEALGHSAVGESKLCALSGCLIVLSWEVPLVVIGGDIAVLTAI